MSLIHPAAAEEQRLQLEAQYKRRIRELDERVKSVRAKVRPPADARTHNRTHVRTLSRLLAAACLQEKRITELERMKVRADEACRKLQTDIVAIKQQKVTLHRHMEKSSREFADFRRQHDKELLQLRKQGRQNAAQLQRMEALHAKQQAVLRRKTGA